MNKSHESVTVVINKDGQNYRFCKLIPSRNDASIFLHLYKHRRLHADGLGKLTFYQGSPILGTVRYDDAEVVLSPIDHSTVHGTGVQHVKFLDNTYATQQIGIPLKGLPGARPLWTIVPGKFETAMVFDRPKGRIHGIKEPPEIPARALSLFAIPKGTFGALNIAFDLDDLGDQIPPPIYVEPVEFRFFDVVFFWYSTGKFIAPPPVTYVFPALGNLAPFIRAVNDQSMEVVLRAITKDN